MIFWIPESGRSSCTSGVECFSLKLPNMRQNEIPSSLNNVANLTTPSPTVLQIFSHLYF
jgi:hypothetical protein